MSETAKMFPSWYAELMDLPEASRKKLIQIVLHNIECAGSKEDKPTPQGKKIVEAIKREYDFVGFSPSVMYLKAEGKRDDLKATFIHPWAMTTLIFKHKSLPLLMHINAAMEKDRMYLAEIPFNKAFFRGILSEGITG